MKLGETIAVCRVGDAAENSCMSCAACVADPVGNESKSAISSQTGAAPDVWMQNLGDDEDEEDSPVKRAAIPVA